MILDNAREGREYKSLFKAMRRMFVLWIAVIIQAIVPEEDIVIMEVWLRGLR
jgi:hypothetical protein